MASLQIMKCDVEGAEFAMFDKLLEMGRACIVDHLYFQCHDWAYKPGACARLMTRLRTVCPNMTISEEGRGPYNGIDGATMDEIKEMMGIPKGSRKGLP